MAQKNRIMPTFDEVHPEVNKSRKIDCGNSIACNFTRKKEEKTDDSNLQECYFFMGVYRPHLRQVGSIVENFTGERTTLLSFFLCITLRTACVFQRHCQCMYKYLYVYLQRAKIERSFYSTALIPTQIAKRLSMLILD